MLVTMAKRTKVAIIGAGAAGIAAASRLVENGLQDIIILEAENRIGGRIYSVEYDNTCFDFGAQWCHGEEDNIVYTLAKDLDVLSSSINDYTDFKFYLSDGTLIDKSFSDALVAISDKIFSNQNLANSKETVGDYFIREYKQRVKERFTGDLLRKAELFLDWFHKAWLCVEGSTSWFDMFSISPYEYVYCKGDLYLNWRDKGYKTLLDILTKKIPDSTKELPIYEKILLNKEVIKIVWDSNDVHLTCSDGSLYICDHVITTVSLGVLKNMLNKFVPPLPLNKQTSIEILPIGNVHKIFLIFTTRWWPDDSKGFSVVWSEEDKENLHNEFPFGPINNGRSWLEDIYGFYVVDNHPRTLLVWVVGSMVEQVENLTDEMVMNGTMFLIEKFLGKTYNVSKPKGILRSKWKNNRHFNGCYTHRSLESDRQNISFEDIATPVVNKNNKEVLLFAGEATHNKYYSTVHGAVETGFREADRLLNIYRSVKLHRQVAIIGAGAAGLGAATTLHELGFSDFIIIEAQNRPGGRIHTLEFGENIIELGAQWIHGRDNPLYEFACKHNLLSEVTSEEGLGTYLMDNGEVIDKDIVKKVDFVIGKFLSQCEDFVKLAEYPKSVGDYLREKFTEYLQNSDDSEEIKRIKWALFDWHVIFQIIDNSCQNLNKLSAKFWGQYVCLDDIAHNNLNCGFNKLVETLVDSIPKKSLLLSTPVSSIQRASNSFETNRLICENGMVVTCNYLIITSSLGVLKQLNITPPLPKQIRQSIKDLGFYGIGKIFITFEYKWWTQDGFQFVWTSNSLLDDETAWVKYITGFDSVLHAPTTLLGWVGGEGVQVMESLSDEDVGVHCMKLLRRFIRNQTIPEPVKVVKTMWCSNPWILGAYSHVTTACDQSGSGMQNLSEPVFVDGKPSVLLAGEATHPSHYSTIHGAFESGKRQAAFVGEYLIKKGKL